ncbi:MAG: HlyD family efflux transporter periplasmic adaptor subunit [Roseovarius sp.]
MNTVVQPGHMLSEIWARLVAAGDAAEVRGPWLELACARIGPVREALIYDRIGDAGYRVTATWPQTGPDHADLVQLAREAVEARRGLVSLPQAADGSLRGGCHLAYPLVLGDFVHGAVAISLMTDQQAGVNEAMRNLQWALGWLRDFLRQQVNVGNGGAETTSRLALEGVADMVGPDRFDAAAQTLVTRLAARFGLERVAIGFARRGAVRVAAISNSAGFGHRMTLVRLTEAAMEEAMDQERAVLHPAAGHEDDTLRRAHDALMRETGSPAILTMPLVRDDAVVGALLCEASAQDGFSQRDIDALNAVAAFAGPVLLLRREVDRNIVAQNFLALGRMARGLLGRSHLGAKLVGLTASGVVAAVMTIQTTYEITADAAVEAAVQRALVAPYDGFIVEAPRRAGDTVAEGDLVAALDDRERALEALFWQSERLQRRFEYDRALGARDIGQLNILQAQLEQAEIRLQLIDAELAQAQLHAPIGGVIVAGDLSQSIGAAVLRGEELFRIAPLDDYRLILDVDEAQIGQVMPGMSGNFLSTSLPGAPQGFTVSTITPVATAREGRTVFRVEGSIDHRYEGLRPGMRGIGKIDAGEASLAWVWTRQFRDWLRMAAWSWMP